jgi:hypothetical protein
MFWSVSALVCRNKYGLAVRVLSSSSSGNLATFQFLFDENVSDAIIKALRRKYSTIGIVRVRDTLLNGKHDDVLLEWAVENRHIIVTYDKRMLSHFNERIAAEKPVFAVFVLRLSCGHSEIIESLSEIIEATETDEWEGQFQYIPL